MSDDRVARNVDGYLDHLGPADLGIVLGLAGRRPPADAAERARHRGIECRASSAYAEAFHVRKARLIGL